MSLCFSIFCLFFPLNIFLCFSILINRYYSIPRALLLFPQKARYFWVQDSQIPFVSSPRLEGHSFCCGPDEEVVVMAEAAVAQCQALVLALCDFTKGVNISFVYLCSSLVIYIVHFHRGSLTEPGDRIVMILLACHVTW